MSKIVSPYPPLDHDPGRKPPAEAQWWRLRLLPNEDNILYFMRTDADEDGNGATWIEYEVFDGEDAILDAGFDAPRVHQARMQTFPPSPTVLLDLLCVGRPSPSEHWEQLTEPGKHRHPEQHLNWGVFR